MPNALVTSFAKKSGRSVGEVEKIWREIVDQQKGEVNYAIVVSVLKKRLKIEEVTTTGVIAKPDVLLGTVRSPNGITPFGHPYFNVSEEEWFKAVMMTNKSIKVIIDDNRIRNWIKKNPLKSVYYNYNGAFTRVR